jgi:hypothetical protein
MTSSVCLRKRRQMVDDWSVSNFSDMQDGLGGWSDHYIINGGFRECHPDFQAVPIGDPSGFMVCKRKHDGVSPKFDQTSSVVMDSATLYQESAKPRQLSDPYSFDQRKNFPNRELIERDYFGRQFYFDGIGMKPITDKKIHRFYGYAGTANVTEFNPYLGIQATRF